MRRHMKHPTLSYHGLQSSCWLPQVGECGVGVADNGSLVTRVRRASRGVYDLLRRWLFEKPFSGQWSGKQLGRLLV